MVMDMAKFFKSLKRREAEEKDQGVRSMATGKEAMPINVYTHLAEYFVRRGDLFAWAYLVVSWNLICRTKNAEGLKFSHISWDADSMIIYFAKMKNDQGEAIAKQ